MHRQHLLHSRKTRILGSACAALIAYGCWAFYVNSSYPLDIALRAALTQGGYSFVLTLVMAWFTEGLFNLLKPIRWRGLLTFLIICSLLYGTAWSINAVMGTPEILLTILPGAVIGTIYTSLYCLTLSRLRHSRAANH